MKSDKPKKKINIWIKAAILLFWLLVWQIAAYAVDNRILLAGPVDVLLRLKEDLATADFYRSVAGSIGRIMAGFFMGFAAGVCFGSECVGRKRRLCGFQDGSLCAVRRCAGHGEQG